MRNDPGHWGSINPKVLVLGFSKGSTQADVYANGRFEDVPFAGCRDRLTDVLHTVGAMSRSEVVEGKFRPDEPDFAFASLVRCSLSRLDNTGNYVTSGAIIKKAFREPEARRFIERCTETFLSALPERLRVILMLGVDDDYIRNCRAVFARLHRVHAVNQVAYTNGMVTWVHVAHPSRGNGYFNTWRNGDPQQVPIAHKRELATEVIRGILGE